jgi:hypothetical protein
MAGSYARYGRKNFNLKTISLAPKSQILIMKQILSKAIFIAIGMALIFQPAKCQTTPKEITDKFFGLYSTDPIKALEYGFSTNKWTARKPDCIFRTIV